MGSFDTNLFDEFRRLESEMDQLVGRRSLPAGIRAMRRGTFPPINVGATPERVDVYLFAAGLDPKSLDISIQLNASPRKSRRRRASRSLYSPRRSMSSRIARGSRCRRRCRASSALRSAAAGRMILGKGRHLEADVDTAWASMKSALEKASAKAKK